MSRIFSSLAVVAVLMLLVALAFGLRVGEYNETYTEFVAIQQQLRDGSYLETTITRQQLQQQADLLSNQMVAPQQRARTHMLMGIATGLLALFVNSVSVTYFIGTSRWCKEVVDTYELETELAEESKRLKRRCFAWAFLGMLLVLVTAALGAAADPGTLRLTTGEWVLPHFAAAMSSVALITLSFLLQAGYIHRNSKIVEKIMLQVRQVRVQRGLEVEA